MDQRNPQDIWLVVEPTSLKNRKVNWDDEIPNRWKIKFNKIHNTFNDAKTMLNFRTPLWFTFPNIQKNQSMSHSTKNGPSPKMLTCGTTIACCTLHLLVPSPLGLSEGCPGAGEGLSRTSHAVSQNSRNDLDDI